MVYLQFEVRTDIKGTRMADEGENALKKHNALLRLLLPSHLNMNSGKGAGWGGEA